MVRVANNVNNVRVKLFEWKIKAFVISFKVKSQIHTHT